jgi:metal-sulfur cluster biosynthetic enzyme
MADYIMKKNSISKSQIITVLKKIPDPELNISIYDLGLINNITIGKKGDVHILMTLTSIGCPLFSTIQSEMERKIKKIKGVISVTTELTFDPPWNMDRMSKEARKQLGL